MSSRSTHAARRPTLAVAGALLLLVASGCASTSGKQRWWPERERWSDALRHAVRSPATWAPAIAAAGFAATDWDTKVSDWARRETPLFGSTDGAQQASDALLVAVNLGMAVSALAVPTQDRPLGGRAGRLFLEEGTVLLDSALVEGLKHATTRERPNGQSELSFPSGHSAGAFASATLANRNLNASTLSPAARTAFTVGFDVLAAGTAWARVEAGAHYPSDVLVGAALGHFVSAWIYDAWLGSASPPTVAFELSPTRHGIAFGLDLRLPSKRR